MPSSRAFVTFPSVALATYFQGLTIDPTINSSMKILIKNKLGKTSRAAIEMPSKCAVYFVSLPQDHKPH